MGSLQNVRMLDILTDMVSPAMGWGAYCMRFKNQPIWIRPYVSRFVVDD
jgi:hypothetical protein